jgi:hypothetical protein
MGKRSREHVPTDPEWHRKMFPEFCHYEILGGGPDPHMQMAVHQAKDSCDPVWFLGGCYIGPYVVSSAEFLAQEWPTAVGVLDDEVGFRRWMEENYRHLEIRRERRAIYGVNRFTDFMLGYAKWCREFNPPGTSFDDDWKYICTVPMNGRYGSMKLYETLLMAGILKHHWYDIRPHGGPTPREALAWLRPELSGLHKRNDAAAIWSTNMVAQSEKNWLREECDLDLNWFSFEVLLCEYRQNITSQSQYPGRSHDSELGRAIALEAKLPNLRLRMWQDRKDLFPHQPLGELGNRWAGRRDGLGKIATTLNYTWSDMLFDYTQTKDLANPVRWNNA